MALDQELPSRGWWQAIFLRATEPRAARPERSPAAVPCIISRPRPVGGVNQRYEALPGVIGEEL
jgi:hypothetical protein